MWVYHSPIGDMFISLHETGKYVLLCNDELYGFWNSSAAVADDVYHHVTGCSDWDMLDGNVDTPVDLSDWEPV